MAAGYGQHALLRDGALDIIVLDQDVLLQDLEANGEEGGGRTGRIMSANSGSSAGRADQ
jgi:hypothetical protein